MTLYYFFLAFGKVHMLQQIQPQIQRLGWEDKGSHLDK